MNHERKPRSVILTMDVPDRILAQTLLEEWSGRRGVLVNILRARLTPDAARYEIEVRGSATDVADILREGARWRFPRHANRLIPVPALA